VGHIGILGVDKKGVEWYQLTLGGSSDNDAAIGERLGPAVAKEDVTQAIITILEVYASQRAEEESFLTMVNRVGIEPFRERVYATA
jgi:sulfite reductase (NADPH) hemoprotein beta-component